MAARRKKPSKTLNLALQGGGAHGAFTWGVLDYLLEDGRVGITGISGTSAGAINAAVLADGIQRGGPECGREQLTNFWEKLSTLDHFSLIQRTPLDRASGDFSLDFSPGRIMYDNFIKAFSPYEFNPFNYNPLLELMKTEIDFDRVRECSAIKLFICCLLYTSPSPRDKRQSRMPSSA